jgi:hypothetical protein
MLGAFFWYNHAAVWLHILPLSVLVATLVTVALLTKNSELVAMKACGISLYRVAAPMLVVRGGGRCAVRPRPNRARPYKPSRRGTVQYHARPGIARVDISTRRWLAGAAARSITSKVRRRRTAADRVVGTESQRRPGARARRVFAERATFIGEDADRGWLLAHGWTREIDDAGSQRATPRSTRARSRSSQRRR